MTEAQRALLGQIRAVLFGRTPVEETPELLAEAEVQALVPMICPDSTAAKRYCLNYFRVLYVQDQLMALFSDAEIPVAVIKGTAASVYYPEPSVRTMGDIDLLVGPGYFEKAAALMAEKGYAHKHGDTASRHIEYKKDHVEVELHRYFSDKPPVEDRISAGFPARAQADLGGHRFWMLPPLENGLVLLEHAARHLQGDMGLRQVIDWMMYVDRVLDDGFWFGEFRTAARDCGLETLAVELTRMCQRYLGLPERITWCRSGEEQVSEALVETILGNGNFGMNQKFTAGELISSDVARGIRKQGVFRFLQSVGEKTWSAYHRHHWLRPLCWAYQLGRYAVRLPRHLSQRREMMEGLTWERERYDLLRQLGIDE